MPEEKQLNTRLLNRVLTLDQDQTPPPLELDRSATDGNELIF